MSTRMIKPERPLRKGYKEGQWLWWWWWRWWGCKGRAWLGQGRSVNGRLVTFLFLTWVLSVRRANMGQKYRFYLYILSLQYFNTSWWRYPGATGNMGLESSCPCWSSPQRSTGIKMGVFQFLEEFCRCFGKKPTLGSPKGIYYILNSAR